jgi:catechol 2,3-dioxygenase-like lactoylglutathione lyase family enzyme
MLAITDVHASVPAADLKRARAFYTDKIGLTPTLEDETGIRFTLPSGAWFQLYETAYAGTGKHTIAQWDVEDLSSTVAELSGKGVTFEHYEMPGVTWDGSIADLGGQRAAWFTDSEGNTMCLDERASG